jgi:amino acid adenylation domain-containing protein
LFETQVKRTPEAPAVVFGEQILTYGELNVRANQLAHYLRSEGVGLDTLVGLCVERSLEMVIGLLGILKAGGAYVPLDPDYPLERLGFILKDTGAPIVLCQQSMADVFADQAVELIQLDSDWDNIAGYPQVNLMPVAALNLAYVLYTSGSTGQPKGVPQTHVALNNLIQWHRDTLACGVRTLQYAPLVFDPSFHECFSAWQSGGSVFIVPTPMRRDIAALRAFIVEHAIEKAMLPGVVLQLLAEDFLANDQIPAALKEIFGTGEQLHLTKAIIEFFKRAPHCSLHNHYGPSETHVITAFTYSGPPSSWAHYTPIGRPIANTDLYVLDRHLNPVPVGVPGELYAGGKSLARGYLHRPSLTAERYIPHPFSDEPGARLYRTGDRVRYLADGNLEFLGRLDHQVKLRGFRIELGEIETALRAHPAINEAVVLLREDEPGNKRLVAYLLAEMGVDLPESAALRAHLHTRLPDYMLPVHYVTLEALPLTTNGKLDRRALPAPECQSVQGYVAPRNPTEQAIADIWAQVLRVEKVGIHDNFFELGGHSLTATQLVSMFKEYLKVDLPIRAVFEVPTIAGLMDLVEVMEWARAVPSEMILEENENENEDEEIEVGTL